MEVISFKSIIFGSIFSLILFLGAIHQVIFLKLFKVRIKGILIFDSGQIHSYYSQKLKAKIALAWMPFGSGVQLENPVRLLPNLKEYKKLLISFIPTFTYFLTTIISFIILNSINKHFNVPNVLDYYKEALHTIMFSDGFQKVYFEVLTIKLMNESNIIIYSLFLYSSILLFWCIIDNFINYSGQKYLGIITTGVLRIILSVFLIWRISVLIFTYFTIPQILIYGLNCLFGIYIIGFVLYFTTILILRFYDKRLNITS